MSTELMESIFDIGVFVMIIVLYLRAQSRADKERGRADAAFAALDRLMATHKIERVVITRTTANELENTDKDHSA